MLLPERDEPIPFEALQERRRRRSLFFGWPLIVILLTGLGFAALTLTATSTIDFGAGNTGNVLHFANSGGTTWTNGTILYINNYTGSVIQQDGSTVTGSTNDALLFGTDNTGLNGTQITQVEFVNPSGYTGTFGASIDNTGMVFADVPEPATILGGVLMVGLLGWNRRRQLRGLIGAPA